MSSLKKPRKNMNIVNKQQQQWRSFSVDDIELTKPNKIKYSMIDGYDQIKNTHRFNKCC